MLLVTFSGLDGCGKSTHVEAAAKYIEARGYRVRKLVTFDISIAGFATVLRDAFRRMRGARQQQERGATGHVIRRLPGNRAFAEDRARPAVRLKRLAMYPVDSLVLGGWLLMQKARGTQAVVCDRYVFDRLVNLPRPDGAFARLLLALAPRPDVAVFLDVPPSVCRARREEHPAEYYASKYESYVRIAQRFGLLRVGNDDLGAATDRIVSELAFALDSPADRSLRVKPRDLSR